jgi:hypothetical protein
LQRLGGVIPDATEIKSVTQGGKVGIEFEVKQPANRLRIKADVTTSGSAGTGTDVVSTALASLHIWKGNKQSVLGAGRKGPVVEVTDAAILEAARLSRARVNNVARGTIPLTDETIAANDTYKLSVDLVLNLDPGQYYAEFKFISAASLAGYTTAPTSVQASVIVIPLCEGLAYEKPDTMRVYKQTDSSLTSGKATEIMIKLAATDQEADITQWTFGGVNLSGAGLTFLAEEGLSRTGSSSMTCLYQTSKSPGALQLKWSSSKTFYVGEVGQ